jgi:translation initiation factor eIF-2B subunit beta
MMRLTASTPGFSRLARFELSLRHHSRLSVNAMVIETLEIIRELIGSSRSPHQLQSSLRSAFKRLQSIAPIGHVVSNVCHRVSAIFLDETPPSTPSPPSPSPVFPLRRSQSVGFVAQLLNPTSATRPSPSPDFFRQPLLEELDELIYEAQTFPQDISKRAVKFIHDGDVVLTIGQSNSVFNFFARAALDRHFAVFVLEHAPAYDGLTMAYRLRALGIECLIIPDSAVFAVMPFVTTIFASIWTIFADGTLVGPSFTKSTFMAARHHSRPVVVLYSRNKIADRFFRLGDSFSELGPPSQVGELPNGVDGGPVILNPDGEVVARSLTTLFINENGAHDPAEVFQLVQSLYPPGDDL